MPNAQINNIKSSSGNQYNGGRDLIINNNLERMLFFYSCTSLSNSYITTYEYYEVLDVADWHSPLCTGEATKLPIAIWAKGHNRKPYFDLLPCTLCRSLRSRSVSCSSFMRWSRSSLRRLSFAGMGFSLLFFVLSDVCE